MKFLFSLLTIISFVLLGNSFAGQSSKVNNSVVNSSIVTLSNPGDKAPEFELKSIDGKVVKLSKLKGKVVIIDFWATWCPPCRKGIPDLVELQKEYKNKLVVIGISVDKETAKDVKDFVAKNGINYPIVMYTEQLIKDYGGIGSIPTAFFIDKKGNIVDKFVGLQDKQTYVDLIKKYSK